MFLHARRPLAAAICLLVAVISPGRARAAITGTPAEGGTRGDWAMLTLEFPALQAAGEIQLRDSRGGVQIVLPLAAGTRSTTFSMPLIAPAELAGTTWALDARLLDGGTLVEEGRISLPLPAQQHTFRIAIPRGTPAEITPERFGKSFSESPVYFIEMPADDFLQGSPLIFAGCDGLLVTPQIRGGISDARRVALLSAGIQLITLDVPQPASADSVWRSLGDAENKTRGWVSPPTPLRRPSLLSPELSQVAVPSIEPARPVTLTLVLAGPATVIATLIARGLFKKLSSIHLAVTCAMVAVPAAMIAYLSKADVPTRTGFHLCEASADLTDPGGGAMLDEQFFAQGTLFGGSLEFEAPDGSLVLPQFASARTYFAAPVLQLRLADPERLEGQQRARQMGWFVQFTGRSIPATAGKAHAELSRDDLLKRWSIDPSRAWWVTGGYVRPANSTSPDGTKGILVTKWAQQQSPRISEAARAWEALRLQGANDYVLWQDDANDRLNVLDLGPAKQ